MADNRKRKAPKADQAGPGRPSKRLQAAPPPRMTRSRFKALNGDDQANQEPTVQLNPGLPMGPRRRASPRADGAAGPQHEHEHEHEASRAATATAKAHSAPAQVADDVGAAPPSPAPAPVAYMGGLGEEIPQQQRGIPSSVEEFTVPSAAYRYVSHWEKSGECDIIGLLTTPADSYAAELPVSFPTPPWLDCVPADPVYRASEATSSSSSSLFSSAPSPRNLCAIASDADSLLSKMQAERNRLQTLEGESMDAPCSAQSPLSGGSSGREQNGAPCKLDLATAAAAVSPRSCSPISQGSQGSANSLAVEPSPRRMSRTQSLPINDPGTDVFRLHDDKAVSDGCIEYGEYSDCGKEQEEEDVSERPVEAAEQRAPQLNIPGLGALDGDGALDQVQPAGTSAGPVSNVMKNPPGPSHNVLMRGATGELQIVSLQRESIAFPPWPYGAFSPVDGDDQFSVEMNDEDPLSY